MLLRRALTFAAVVSLSAAGTNATPLGLVAHWDITPSSGFDDVVGGFNPTSTLNATLVPDRFGNLDSAVALDGDSTLNCCSGDSSYLEIPQSPTLNPSSFTIAFWIQFGAYELGAAPQPIDSSDTIGPGVEGGYTVGFDPGQGSMFFRVGNTHLPAIGVTFEPGWHHVAGTYDPVGHVMRVYIDGNVVAELIDAVAVNGYSPSTVNNWVIGNANQDLAGSHHNFVGLMDDIRLYDRALSSAEIATLPEPALGVALATSILGLAFRGRRRRARTYSSRPAGT